MSKPIPLRAMLLGLVLMAPSSFSADFSLIPHIETRGGYENNRLQEPGDGSGSACWGGSSGIEMLLIGEWAEASFSFAYQRTQYEKREWEWKDDGLVQAQIRFLRGRNEYGATAGGGFCDDKSLPENDALFQQASPFFIHSLENNSAEWIVKGFFRRTDYDSSVYTATSGRVDVVCSVRPEWRWFVSRRTSLWAEVVVEKNLSDTPEAEYAGIGGTVGGDFRPTSCLTLGGWISPERRAYDEDVADQSHQETLLRVGGWGAFRMRPWMEFFAYINGESVACTLDDDEYTAWDAGFGMRFTFEYQLSSLLPSWSRTGGGRLPVD